MWRETLGKIIRVSQERQRIADELGIKPITLLRWVTGESNPRPQNLRLLFHVLPEYRQQFLEFLQAEFGASFVEEINEDAIPYEIPAFFYTRVLHARCILPRVAHLSSISDMILPQVLQQLDPNRVGMQVTLVQCTPPSEAGFVRSLRQTRACSTLPLKSELEQPQPFLGKNSLAGQAVLSMNLQTIKNRQEAETRFSIPDQKWEEGMIACPINVSDYVAGCLLISSALPDYFSLHSRQKLVQQYAQLLTIAFGEGAFYAHKMVNLGSVPGYEVQRCSLISLRRSAVEIMREEPMNMLQAEQLVMWRLEEEFLAHSMV
jgi:transcriptional regulator with XRE-family HTH domain